jgi:DNA-binding NtrC family response regulator
MRESIMMIGVDRYDRMILTKVFSEKYDLLFIDKVDQSLLSNKGPFPKLIIYNIGIGDEESLNALQRVKKLDGLERPIIAITSHNTVEIDRFLATTGVFYHLVRPFELRDLDDLITGAMRFWRKRQLDISAPVETGQAKKN